MTNLEYLVQRWREVKALRDRTANQIARITGHADWMLSMELPGSAMPLVVRWMGYSRTLAALDQDIRCERRNSLTLMILQ